VNREMDYEDIILVLTLSNNEDLDEIAGVSKRIDRVYILHLGICL
jgi:hypothetical protein